MSKRDLRASPRVWPSSLPLNGLSHSKDLLALNIDSLLVILRFLHRGLRQWSVLRAISKRWLSFSTHPRCVALLSPVFKNSSHIVAVSKLKGLQELRFENYSWSRLFLFQHLPSSLKRLYLHHDEVEFSVVSLSVLSFLEVLSFNHVQQVKSIESLSVLKSFHTLEIQNDCGFGEYLYEGIPSLPHLTSLNLQRDDVSTMFEEDEEDMDDKYSLMCLKKLTNLRELNLKCCAVDLSGNFLSHFLSLESLNLISARVSDLSLPCLSLLTNLTSLHLSECEVPLPLSSLTKLKNLSLLACKVPVNTLSAFSQTIERLDLSCSPLVCPRDSRGESLRGLKDLSLLRSLKLNSCCPAFGTEASTSTCLILLDHHLQFLATQLPLLEHLQIEDFRISPSALVGYTNLKTLHCSSDLLEVLPHLSQLQTLKVSMTVSGKLSLITAATKLLSLQLDGAKLTADATFFSSLSSLNQLVLYRCWILDPPLLFSNISSLPQLEILDIIECEGVTRQNLAGFDLIPCLNVNYVSI